MLLTVFNKDCYDKYFDFIIVYYFLFSFEVFSNEVVCSGKITNVVECQESNCGQINQGGLCVNCLNDFLIAVSINEASRTSKF